MVEILRSKFLPKVKYNLNQSPFFKLSSRNKLATILQVPLKDLELLAKNGSNYKIFEIEAKNDPFSKPRKKRHVQEPRDLLAVVHRRIFQLLTRVELPDYLHSTVKEKSYISNASAHKNSIRAIKFDIKNFFPSVKISNIAQFFLHKLSCSPDVSALLAKLCSCNGALPTGSPISPIISFWAYKDMFDALSELAINNDLKFTLYVDDIVFSGDKANSVLSYQVRKIISSAGLTLHERKTKFYKSGTPKIITGIAVANNSIKVVNERFKYIRKLEAAVKSAQNTPEHRKLLEKLVGLLGEASQIESKFAPWLDKYKNELKNLRQIHSTNPITDRAIRRRNKKNRLENIKFKAFNGLNKTALA